MAEHLVMRAAEEAGFAEDDVHKIGMAVREGVVNAYNYGNCQDCQKKIQLIIELDGGKLVVHVVDEGCGFDLEDVADPLAEENLLRTSGRGLFLMRAFMDDLVGPPRSARRSRPRALEESSQSSRLAVIAKLSPV